ncbi:MAG: aldehyde dehydrogenase family protein [Candidatus Peribacteraceae bacterium]|nr:aldehyde dehydrogenase family protein [Candidatus Peribacteraceae bacterium]MDD5742893.1 aldehyde dehydrogenase family protein [Candidatus Peribacteraceae bacterium]
MDTTLRNVEHFINGAWGHAAPDARFDKIDPTSGRVLARVAEATPHDVHAAIEAAVIFHQKEGWAGLSMERMDEIFSRIQDLLQRERDDLSRVVARETGKSSKEANAEIEKAMRTFKAIQYQKYQSVGEVLPSQDKDCLVFSSHYPVGVTGVVTPWNFPLYIAAQHLAPAIMGRNTVIMKCSPHVPISSTKLVEILLEAGLPQQMISLLHGTRMEVADLLVSDKRLDMVSFTGSSATAKGIARKREGRKFIFEGGGNNFQVVLADADITSAAGKAVQGTIGFAGQKCVATGNVLVEREVLAVFVEKVKSIMAVLSVGDTSAGADLGPLVGERCHDLESRIQESVAQGGELVLGGHVTHPKGTDGQFFQPTILILPKESPLVREELFAPVLKIIPIDTLDEALAVINAQEYGLAASIYSRGQSAVLNFIRRVRVGLVNVNAATGGSEAHVPFGGSGVSGNGFRLGNPEEALHAFTEVRSVKWYPGQ